MRLVHLHTHHHRILSKIEKHFQNQHDPFQPNEIRRS